MLTPPSSVAALAAGYRPLWADAFDQGTGHAMSAGGMWVGRRRLLLALVVALALAGCGEEPLAPLDARLDRYARRRCGSIPKRSPRRSTPIAPATAFAPVRLDPALTAMAQRQADAMVAGNALSHTVGGAFRARLAASGIDAPEAGENLGAGYFSLEEAMAGWRGSAEHDANLLIARATRIGVAIAKSPHTHYGVYWALEVRRRSAGVIDRAARERPLNWAASTRAKAGDFHRVARRRLAADQALRPAVARNGGAKGVTFVLTSGSSAGGNRKRLRPAAFAS